MFHSVGNVLDLKHSSSGQARFLESAMVVAKATERGQGRWVAIRFRYGRLTLVAPSPIAAQELRLRKESVLNQINEVLGKGVVRCLVVRC